MEEWLIHGLVIPVSTPPPQLQQSLLFQEPFQRPACGLPSYSSLSVFSITLSHCHLSLASLSPDLPLLHAFLSALSQLYTTELTRRCVPQWLIDRWFWVPAGRYCGMRRQALMEVQGSWEESGADPRRVRWQRWLIVGHCWERPGWERAAWQPAPGLSGHTHTQPEQGNTLELRGSPYRPSTDA